MNLEQTLFNSSAQDSINAFIQPLEPTVALSLFCKLTCISALGAGIFAPPCGEVLS